MPQPKPSTKARLTIAALELFIEQGIPATTTKAIAERAEVNEVTLFRHFGNKNGLLLAILTDSDLAPVNPLQGDHLPLADTLETYGRKTLQEIDRLQNLIHSFIGEANQSPDETRLALHQSLQQINQQLAQTLTRAIAHHRHQSHFAPETLAALLHSLLIGYTLIETTSKKPFLSQDDFLANLITLFLQGAIIEPLGHGLLQPISDLPAALVRTILQRAQKLGRQPYAFAYTLFATGISPTELLHLQRHHYINNPDQHLLQINQDPIRQVLLNQWIAGKRYGSDSNNPLYQWLKSRKDNHSNLFLNPQSQPIISLPELQTLWQTITQDLLTPQGHSPALDQTQATWCIEMLMKGIEPAHLSLLSGLTIEQLQPFIQRSQAKVAIAAVTRRDTKPQSKRRLRKQVKPPVQP
jgi:AcrR family transcriptional regulator